MPMIFMGVNQGLGDYSLYPNCSSCDLGDSDCLSSCGQQNTNTDSPSTAGNSGTPWWSTLTTALTAGAATGVTSALVNHPATPPKPAPQPWYLTPGGIFGILLVVGGGAYFLAKK